MWASDSNVTHKAVASQLEPITIAEAPNACGGCVKNSSCSSVTPRSESLSVFMPFIKVAKTAVLLVEEVIVVVVVSVLLDYFVLYIIFHFNLSNFFLTPLY